MQASAGSTSREALQRLEAELAIAGEAARLVDGRRSVR